MDEGLRTADGQDIDLQAAEQAFATAMAAPEPAAAGQPDYPGPRRKRDPDFPFGKNPDGSPVLKYGLNAKGKPAQTAPGPGRGRTKDDKVREQKPAAGTGAVAVPGGKADYSAELVEFTDGMWMLMAGTPIPWAKLADFKRKLRAQAAIVKENQAGIVNAVNMGALHNEQVRAKVEAITTGAVSWVLPAMFMLTPFVASSAALWRTKADDPELAELADGTERDWKAFSADQISQMAGSSHLAAREALIAEREHALAMAAG
jgi:hypothetical protein